MGALEKANLTNEREIRLYSHVNTDTRSRVAWTDDNDHLLSDRKLGYNIRVLIS